ncbi:hypothetical protein F5I97DRAFT_630570 [Phlebopus sp. FC_14]|nr:hypothetical protein F5I97DRAFT_630570 [Phlebopus sp. FC_14]
MVLLVLAEQLQSAMFFQPFLHFHQHALQPIAPFSWFGLGISSLHLLGAFRLCYALRQIIETLQNGHTRRRTTSSNTPTPEDRSFTRDAISHHVTHGSGTFESKLYSTRWQTPVAAGRFRAVRLSALRVRDVANGFPACRTIHKPGPAAFRLVEPKKTTPVSS